MKTKAMFILKEGNIFEDFRFTFLVDIYQVQDVTFGKL